ncbi:hypothetical protein QR680_014385 [Steinernema hermaphroditum]|uniref:MI domain-containing protein n=1 Tax=Steinernema hermaphroditum TaxID=289476 RepID=A0AA39M449_9BILA|nr:hypothetical protein QR680_014385 [Steinernema hermaphroditum]
MNRPYHQGRYHSSSVITALLEQLTRHVQSISGVDARLAALEAAEAVNSEKMRRREDIALELLAKIVNRIQNIEEHMNVQRFDVMCQTEIEVDDNAVQTDVKRFVERETQTTEEVSTVSVALGSDESSFHQAPESKAEAVEIKETMDVTPKEEVEKQRSDGKELYEIQAPASSNPEKQEVPRSSQPTKEPSVVQKPQQIVKPVAVWSRRTCERPFKCVSKKQKLKESQFKKYTRKIMFYMNVWSYKQVYTTEVMKAFKDYGNGDARLIFAILFTKSLSTRKLCRLYGNIVRILLLANHHTPHIYSILNHALIFSLNMSSLFFGFKGALKMQLEYSPYGFDFLDLSRRFVKKKPTEVKKFEKEVIANLSCLFGEMIKHFMINSGPQLEGLKNILKECFDVQKIRFALKFLQLYCDAEQQGLMQMDTTYKEEEENRGRPVKSPKPISLTELERAIRVIELTDRTAHGRDKEKTLLPLELIKRTTWRCLNVEEWFTVFVKNGRLNQSVMTIEALLRVALRSPPQFTAMYAQLISEVADSWVERGAEKAREVMKTWITTEKTLEMEHPIANIGRGDSTVTPQLAAF